MRWGAYLGGAILCSALGGGQLSPSLGAAFARVAVVGVAGAHLVGSAGNGWVNGVRRAGGMGVLGQRLYAGLASSSSEQVFS